MPETKPAKKRPYAKPAVHSTGLYERESLACTQKSPNFDIGSGCSITSPNHS